MSAVKLRDIERFKKSLAGMIEFATLIEQATPRSRERIIEGVEAIDPAFLRKALRKVVYFDEILYLDESILAEILAKTTPQVLAYALSGLPDEFVESVLRFLAYPQMKQTRDEQEKIQTKLATSTILGAQGQILKIARQLEAKNKFVFELADCPRFQKNRPGRLRIVK